MFILFIIWLNVVEYKKEYVMFKNDKRKFLDW